MRNLKILGLALAAVFAMSAVIASVASAQTVGVLTSDGPVTLTGTETGGAGANSFTAFGNTVECPGSTYTGHEKGSTTKLVPNGAKEVTVTPHYVNCNFPVAMNGCDYLFRHLTTVAGVAGTYTFLADVVCPVGKAIEITGPLGCKVKVPAQTGLTGPHLTSTPLPAHDIDLTGTFSNVTATNCFGGHTAAAVLHLDVTIKGHNSLKENTGVTISD